jgi:hypothetical protein
VFSQGAGRFSIFKGHNYLFNYTYGGWIERLFINTMVLYNQSQGFLSTESFITPDYQLLGKHEGGVEDLLHISFSMDLYLKALKTNINGKLGYSSTYSKGNEINGTPYSFHSDYTSVGLKLRSVFNGSFNYITGASWKYSGTSSVVRHSNTDFTQFLDSYFDLSNTLKLQIIAERYRFGGLEGKNNWYFLDGVVHYQLSEKKWKLKLEARNLFDNHQFEQFELTDNGTESTIHRLVSRYFLLGIRYRF